eukprot:TRINITY_DN10935_c0_g1_i1.p1 TRINITY_DN10935_c0_g1~~TRINITY_DN10935_c0_g1_i1.p1  ORF type:complete len:249 (+),score=83.51 TRINITY_DN10935_c0_g1_i1:129-875(+)
MIRRPPRSTQSRSSAASDVYKRQPVYLGASGPLNGDFHDLGGPVFHGVDGLGGVPRPAVPSHGVNMTLTAAEAIVEACQNWNPKPVLISLSPLTNVALALELEPRLPELCPDLFLMGGTVTTAGNVSPVSEANIANDADAAAAVLSAGFDTRIAGLDVTMAVWLDTPYLEKFIPLEVGRFVWNITRFYTHAYKTVGGFPDGMPLHDPSAVMMLLQPSLFQLTTWNCTCLLYTSPSPRDRTRSRMPSSA